MDPRNVAGEMAGLLSWTNESSVADILHLDPSHVRIAEANSGGRLHVARQPPDGREISFRASVFEPLERNCVQRDWVFARVKRRVRDGKVWLRLRSTSVLGHQTIHYVSDYLLRANRIAVDNSNALCAKAGAKRESPPIVDVRNGYVVKTAGDAVGGTIAHHRNVDDFCH